MRVLVVGAGSIGQRHMRNIKALQPQTEFIVVKRLATALEAWPDARIETQLMDALGLTPNFAIVASPSARHIDTLPTLIEAGIATYVEKPMVTSREQVDIVRAALANSGTNAHMAGFNLRHISSLKAARTSIASGHLGSIVRASFSAGQWLPDWRPMRDHRETYSAVSSEGGGVIFDLCHELDAARFLLGDMAIEAVSTSQVSELAIESEAAAVVTARSGEGALVCVNVDYVARKPIRRYEVVGTRATLVWDLSERSLTVSDKSGSKAVLSGPDDFNVAATYPAAMELFLARKTSEDGAQSLEDGLKSTMLAIEAHETKRLQ